VVVHSNNEGPMVDSTRESFDKKRNQALKRVPMPSVESTTAIVSLVEMASSVKKDEKKSSTMAACVRRIK